MNARQNREGLRKGKRFLGVLGREGLIYKGSCRTESLRRPRFQRKNPKRDVYSNGKGATGLAIETWWIFPYLKTIGRPGTWHIGTKAERQDRIKQETRHNNLRGAWGFSPSIEKEKQDTGEEPGLQATMQASQRRARLTKHPGKSQASLPGLESHYAARPARRAKTTIKLARQSHARKSKAWLDGGRKSRTG